MGNFKLCEFAKILIRNFFIYLALFSERFNFNCADVKGNWLG